MSSDGPPLTYIWPSPKVGSSGILGGDGQTTEPRAVGVMAETSLKRSECYAAAINNVKKGYLACFSNGCTAFAIVDSDLRTQLQGTQHVFP